METALTEQPFGLVSEEGIRRRLDVLADESRRGCGLSWELYVQLLSASVDSQFASAPPHVREVAISIATDMGYQTREEIAALLQELEDAGYCHHGLDPRCCPCGCGDIERFEPDSAEYEWPAQTLTASLFEDENDDTDMDEKSAEVSDLDPERIPPRLGRWARLKMRLKSHFFRASN